LYYLRSIPVGADVYLGALVIKNPSKDSDYLTSRRLVAHSFETGDIGNYESTSEVDKKIREKKRDIAKFDSTIGGKENDYYLMITRKTKLEKRIAELRKKELNLTSADEGELRTSLVSAHRRITGGSKVLIDDYNLFDTTLNTSAYSRFQEFVKNRLVSEGKLTSEEAKT